MAADLTKTATEPSTGAAVELPRREPTLADLPAHLVTRDPLPSSRRARPGSLDVEVLRLRFELELGDAPARAEALATPQRAFKPQRAVLRLVEWGGEADLRASVVAVRQGGRDLFPDASWLRAATGGGLGGGVSWPTIEADVPVVATVEAELCEALAFDPSRPPVAAFELTVSGWALR